MSCDSCYWNTYCSQAERDLNINGNKCEYCDDIDSDGEYFPTREGYYRDFYKYMEENGNDE